MLFLLLFSLFNLFGQKVIEINFSTQLLDFENFNTYEYILLDSTEIWDIGISDKEILFLPNGGKALFTDTNQYYRSNLDASAQFRLFFESGFNGYGVSFLHKFDFEGGIDGGKIEISYNRGVSWQNILLDPEVQNQYFFSEGLYSVADSVRTFDNEPGFTGQQSSLSYCHIEWVFDHVLDTVLFRFTMQSDSNNNFNEGWMIDDIQFFSILGSIRTNDLHDFIRVYPNPATEILMIKSDHIFISKINIYSVYGQLMVSRQDRQNREFNIAYFDPGLYLIIINDFYITKFLKL